jgi:two-component system, NarL family, sensor kinase
MDKANLPESIDTKTLFYHLENTPFGVMLWDRQLRLEYCSKKAAKIFHCEPDDLQDKPFNLVQFVHPDDAAAVSALISDISSGRTMHSQSLNRNLTEDGKVIYCQWYNSALKDEKGKIINVLSLFQDVTDQIQTQLALQKSEHQLSLAFNSAIDPMWLIRVEGYNQFRFETINAAFTKVTGWTPAQVEGQLMENVIPPESHDLVRQKYNEAINAEKIVDYIEESLHPSGVKYGEIRVIPIRSQGDEPVRILGIANDITEKVYLQKKLDAEREVNSRQITSQPSRGRKANEPRSAANCTTMSIKC